MVIALAFGTSAASDLVSSLVSERVPAWSSALSTFDTYSYMAVFGFWLVMLALPEPARKTVQDSPMRLVFQRWNDTLLSTPFAGQSNLAMASMDSFLPNVERTVERVMARKMTQ
jgi:cyanate permease